MNIFRSAKHRPRHPLLAYLLLAAILIAGLAVGGAAQAATRTAAAPSAPTVAKKPCTFTNGKTSILMVTHHGIVPEGGTIFKMPAHPKDTDCRDLNISYVSATDHYTGWVFVQTKKGDFWQPCSSKIRDVRIRKGHQNIHKPPVLCHLVGGGTLMAVVTESGTQRKITAEY
jgi:hypothetical protein